MVFNLDIPIRKSWGQNFIIDKNTIDKIVKIIQPIQNEHIIEIGPGRGAITMPLLNKVKYITAIEIDPLLVQYLNKEYIFYGKEDNKKKTHFKYFRKKDS